MVKNCSFPWDLYCNGTSDLQFLNRKMELLLSKKVGIFKTFLIVFFGEEFSRLDERDFGNFIGPKVFYDFLMVKILKKLFLINEELNQKSPLIQKIVHRVFGSRSGNFEDI